MLEEFRGRGLDSLFYVETARALLRKGYSWVDMSLIAENNENMAILMRNLGWELYKVYRTYHMDLTS